jgi:glycosyltransferase involved in cell wall biosynthesis
MDMLIELGHQVAVYAWFGFDGHMVEIEGIPVYPRIDHPFGGDADLILRHWPADLLITIHDIWPLPDDFGDRVRAAGAKWLAYFPVDGTPVPPMVAAMAEQADYSVVYSHFAGREMEKAGLDYTYTPQMIDVETFKPGDKAEARRDLGIPLDVFLVLMVGANVGYPNRKAIPESIMAFQDFNRRHPKSVLFIHARKTMPVGHGYQLGILSEKLGLNGAVKFINQDDYMLSTIQAEDMAGLYRAADVLLNPSTGEGFGLPIAEAQACGTPVITQAVTAMTEITINGVAIQAGQLFYTRQNHFQFMPKIEKIIAALNWIYDTRDRQYVDSATGSSYFYEYHRPAVVAAEYWAPLLEKIEAGQKEKELSA